MTAMQSSLHYAWHSFEELTTNQLYDLLRLRQEVFVVEQKCAYLDTDGLDQQAMHLLVYETRQKELVGYLRLIAPQIKFTEPALGRLVTASSARGSGLARKMMIKAMGMVKQRFPETGIRLSAQLYLERFYNSLGFTAVSEVYDEDGIPHIEMLYQPS